MIIIDTDVLSIQHIFTTDKRFSKNREFIEKIKKFDCGKTKMKILTPVEFLEQEQSLDSQ